MMNMWQKRMKKNEVVSSKMKKVIEVPKAVMLSFFFSFFSCSLLGYLIKFESNFED